MTLKQLHARTNKQLRKEADFILNCNDTKSYIIPIAEKHGVSIQTVLNYIHGTGKDGYLKDLFLLDIKEINKNIKK